MQYREKPPTVEAFEVTKDWREAPRPAWIDRLWRDGEIIMPAPISAAEYGCRVLISDKVVDVKIGAFLVLRNRDEVVPTVDVWSREKFMARYEPVE